MVAKTIALPNIRELFLPDPGHVILDCDLSGADAQVVAWEANDADLKAAFRRGEAIHVKNLLDVFPEKVPAGLGTKEIKKLHIYHNSKQMAHGTNYAGSPMGVALAVGWPVREVERFQDRWFTIHPGIKDWHLSLQASLYSEKTPGTIYNQWGYRRVYFDRLNDLLPKASAWIGQSTVAILARKAMVNVAKNLPWVQFLLQVHDSLVFQIPSARMNSSSLKEIHSHLHLPIPYDDPLIIPWSFSWSNESWGACEETEWPI